MGENGYWQNTARSYAPLVFQPNNPYRLVEHCTRYTGRRLLPQTGLGRSRHLRQRGNQIRDEPCQMAEGFFPAYRSCRFTILKNRVCKKTDAKVSPRMRPSHIPVAPIFKKLAKK